ncbi:hypothetical protein SAMN06265795_10492 [Noviherbaspirillum humi]|uniref:Methyltransferase domain-containing protein n=2 Tax=Noviherbaspirillum humi TaxID=1688639 RepID=A0A239FTB8_9BURK|nr:hypothetical protein SAMN06265795_10492 [Noviherbaspirillum humi]
MPALTALLIQCLSLALVLTAASLFTTLFAAPFTIGAAVLAQGVVSALLARWARMASWWLLIHLLFPPALLATLALHLPAWLFLAAFLALTALYWNTFRTQVPYFPSRMPVWRAVCDLMPADGAPRFIDIGSGFGGLSLHLARMRPDARIHGIELAPLPWLVSWLQAQARTAAPEFLRGDYNRLDLASYDVVFAYLSPAAMPALWRKARREMRAGALLLSYEFEIPGVAPDIVVSPTADGPKLHGWRM